LRKNKESVYYLDEKYNENFPENDKLKIMFRNIVSVSGENNEIEMINKWTTYKNTNNKKDLLEKLVYIEPILKIP